jgi:hypothetical protein
VVVRARRSPADVLQVDVIFRVPTIRDGRVSDWESLTRFQKSNDLRFIEWGSSMVGDAPAVVTLLDELQSAGLVKVTGIDLRQRYLAAERQFHSGTRW